MIPPRKMFLIEWSDSCAEHGWQSENDVSNVPATCWTVGFIVRDGLHGLTVAPTVSNQGLTLDPLTIPKGCIQSIKQLRVR